MTLWTEHHPARWQEEQRLARELLSCVQTGSKGDRVFIEGTFSLRLNCDHELDQFRLRLEYPISFPKKYVHPLVYLVSHHDLWRAGYDSHIEYTWRLCLYVPLESGLDFRREDELSRLFEHIQSFLFRERMYQRDLRVQLAGGPRAAWPGPDRSHGDEGLIEAIQALGGIPKNGPCICGSGKKYKSCCRSRLRKVSRCLRRTAGDLL